MDGCCFRQLRLIRSCIKSLPHGAEKTVVFAFITSRVDRCNSLLAGAPACLLYSSRCSLPRQSSFVTGGSMTTSCRSSVMFSTGCQSHSASSTSSTYSSFYHFTELLQSTCAIAAPGLIPPRLDYGYDHWRGLICVYIRFIRKKHR